MKIAHIALWTTDIDRLAAFWETMFDGKIGDFYESANRKGFKSRFVELSEGAAIEIMTGPWIEGQQVREHSGYAHVAVSLSGRDAVDAMAKKAEALGILNSAPRWTGDGFYEAVIIDPDGNPVEITA